MADRAQGALIAGKYRVESVIDTAMTTTTYGCSHGGHRYFVKVLKTIVADDREDRGRFEREYAVLRSLRHPCIASVVGLEDADGVPCIVMEYLEGETLKQLLDRGPLDLRAAVGILLQLLAALQAAHAQGVIHRDLEPANLFTILRNDGTWQLKIFNFGAARTADAGLVPGGGLTQAGTIIGNPEYMSLEQARGTGVDGRSDLYAVGCVAYAMLTGAPPFTGGGQSVLMRHATEAPRPIRAQRAEVSVGVEKWILRALAKRPEDRFRDATDARAELYAVTSKTIGAAGARPAGSSDVTGRTPAPVAVNQSGGPVVTAGGVKVFTQNDMIWQSAVVGVPKNARMAVLGGDPLRPGPFTVRLMLPGGFRLAPHTHTSPEQITIIAGSIKIGEGRVLAAAKSRRLSSGSYYMNPPGVAHFAWSDEDCLIQVTGTGPWSFSFV